LIDFFFIFGDFFLYAAGSVNLAHGTVSYRIEPQQTIYRSKKYHTIERDFVLETQSSVYRSVPKMHFFPIFNT
jgi:hypothetical protein